MVLSLYTIMFSKGFKKNRIVDVKWVSWANNVRPFFCHFNMENIISKVGNYKEHLNL